MQQTINFYRGGSKLTPVPLGAEWLVLSALGTVVVLAVLAFTEQQRIQSLRATMAAKKNEITATTSLVNDLRRAAPTADAALANELEQTARRVAGLHSLFETVNKLELNRQSFTGYFEALARQTHPDVWLTDIQLDRGGKDIELAGRALVSASIPRLLQTLSDEPVFRTRTFGDLKVHRSGDDQKPVDFALRTSPPEELPRVKP